MEIVFSVLGFLFGTGLLGTVIIRRFDKMDKKNDEREKYRTQESVLVVTHLMKSGDLAEELAVAMINKRCNGEVSSALDEARCSKKELNAFLVAQNARAMGR